MNYEKLPKTISAEELLSTPLPPVKWIIPDLLPAGLALFAGPSKAGKSWLTLWLCLQVAQGQSRSLCMCLFRFAPPGALTALLCLIQLKRPTS